MKPYTHYIATASGSDIDDDIDHDDIDHGDICYDDIGIDIDIEKIQLSLVEDLFKKLNYDTDTSYIENAYSFIDGKLDEIIEANISLYLRKEYLDVLEKLPHDDYVICICYGRRVKDWQIGLTETCKYYKPNKYSKLNIFNKAVQMGLSQELGIKLKYFNKNMSYSAYSEVSLGKRGKCKSRFGIYNIPIEETRPITEIESKLTYPQKDNKLCKSACIVNGTIDDLVNTMSQVKYYQEAPDSKNDIGFFKVSFLIDTIKKIYSHGIFKKSKIITYYKDEGLKFYE
jgi:hypothetical protein